MGMKDGQYGTLCVDIARFYCGSREIWADFLALYTQALFFQNPAQFRDEKEDHIQARARITPRTWRAGDRVRFVLILRVFIADLGRSGLIFFALFTQA